MGLSKTAKASMVRETKEVRVETPEESIRQLRLNLDAELWVTPDRIRVLLTAYDLEFNRRQVAESQMGEAIAETTAKIEALEAELRVLANSAVEMVKAIIPEAIVPLEDLESHDGTGDRTPKKAMEGIFSENPPFVMEEISAGQSFEAGVTQILSPEKIAMAEIPAQEQDEHHMIDFGHHTIHPQAEGGS